MTGFCNIPNKIDSFYGTLTTQVHLASLCQAGGPLTFAQKDGAGWGNTGNEDHQVRRWLNFLTWHEDI